MKMGIRCTWGIDTTIRINIIFTKKLSLRGHFYRKTRQLGHFWLKNHFIAPFSFLAKVYYIFSHISLYYVVKVFIIAIKAILLVLTILGYFKSKMESLQVTIFDY